MALHKQPDFISRFLLLNDFTILNLMLVGCIQLELLQKTYNTITAVICINISLLAVVLRLHLYNTENLTSPGLIFKKTLNAVMLLTVLSITIFYFVNVNLVPTSLLMFMGGYFLTLLTTRALFVHYLKFRHKRGYNYHKVIIVGQTDEAMRLIQYIESGKAFGTQIVGIIDDEPPQTKYPYLGKLKELGRKLSEIEADTLYWAIPPLDDAYMHMLIQKCEIQMLRFSIVPSYMSYTFKNMQVDNYDGLAVMHYRTEPLQALPNRIVKRLFDIVFSSLVIILILSWLIPLIALLVKLTSKGPIFFKQRRSGIANKEFNMYKFRSMRVNDDSDKLQATKNDHRLTPIGLFLRKSNIDEMPQFFNVFLGRMSVIGPRPHMLSHTDEYSKKMKEYMVRHYIKPGISGWAQVNGARGQVDSQERLDKRVKCDIWYIENWSLWVDLKIIFLTVWNMIRGEENAF